MVALCKDEAGGRVVEELCEDEVVVLVEEGDVAAGGIVLLVACDDVAPEERDEPSPAGGIASIALVG